MSLTIFNDDEYLRGCAWYITVNVYTKLVFLVTACEFFYTVLLCTYVRTQYWDDFFGGSDPGIKPILLYSKFKP